MKIAVLNYSGNVGKTTIAKHLLLPRMGNCPWIPIESINKGGDDSLNFKGREITEVLKEMGELDDVVVDIGSSNIETAFSELKKQGDAHEDFDYFLIPTVATEKQQADTLQLVADMLDMEIDQSKIKIVFNQVSTSINPSRVFARLLAQLSEVGVKASLDASIPETEVFGMLTKNQTLAAAINKGRDFKAEIAATDDKQLRRTLTEELIASRLARGVEKELDRVWASLFPEGK